MAKPGPKFDADAAAEALVTAAYKGDKAAAEQHNLSERTLGNYRAKLSQDANFAELFRRKKRRAESEWADELAPAIKESLAFLKRAAQVADASDPDAIHAVAGSLKILGDVAAAKRVLDARFAEEDRSDRAATEEVVIGSEGEEGEPLQ